MNTDVVMPATMHELHSRALEDFAKCEADPRYMIDMTQWHEYNNMPTEPKCWVCFAGTFMAVTLGAGEHTMFPEDFGHAAPYLGALNHLRSGAVGEAAIELGIVREEDLFDMDRYIPGYILDPGQWWEHQFELLTDLRQANL